MMMMMMVKMMMIMMTSGQAGGAGGGGQAAGAGEEELGDRGQHGHPAHGGPARGAAQAAGGGDASLQQSQHSAQDAAPAHAATISTRGVFITATGINIYFMYISIYRQ